MDDKQRLNLQEMIKAYDADDNTSKIRELKHRRRIRDDVEKFVNLKKTGLQNSKKKFLLTTLKIMLDHPKLFAHYQEVLIAV